ncbi:MAG: DNA methyltransferase [Hyphomicrobiaceae bacterium]
MQVSHQPLFADHYLRAIYGKEFEGFRGSDAEKDLIKAIQHWADRFKLKETSAEAAFMKVFFEQIWGYTQSGTGKASSGYTLHPKHAIAGAGASGGTGEADAAMGWFARADVPATPQVVCEFKDVRSNLDAPQKRKGNNRSPVKQCADYLRELVKPLFGHEAVQPTWGLVTDMNEFRLYWRNTMPSQYQRFIITKSTADDAVSLLDSSDAGSFQRFLFARLFSQGSLISTGGPCELLRRLKNQRYQDKEIENTFYREYRAYREQLIKVIIDHNATTFSGTKGRLVRLAQKLIDRCIFVMFCEDMGELLSFPPNALRDYLADLSKLSTFQPDEIDAWNKLKELFNAMNEGKKFRARDINRFNGGLFATDTELDSLTIPNSVFCAAMQGENDEHLRKHPLTLLYFAGTYNFGTSGAAGKAVTLYTLGRIFEQSITELEVLEAAADAKLSLNVLSRRKRDGVYYTPEPIVERIVAETLTPRLDEIKVECGWSITLEGDDAEVQRQIALAPSKRSVAFKAHVDGVKAFRDRLDSFTVLDPACGSGAFLIHTLEYLLRERRRVTAEYARITVEKGEGLFEFKPADEIRTILARNIYGVDINPASVEIAQLALWLHTAKADEPLTNLNTNIVTGNSLVGSDLFHFKKDLLGATDESKERINAFDYEKAFPSVFDPKRPGGSGFDCIVGNPPYVKLQNFKKVYPETAEFLRDATRAGGGALYESCQTGSFDLYLPFIEHGLELLNPDGRLGFIAPSVWRYTEYGKALRKLLHKGGHLERWIDFGSFQVFDEAIIYTALQFYSRKKRDAVQFALAHNGELALIPEWGDADWTIPYKDLPVEDTWILVPKPERELLLRLGKGTQRLSDPKVTQAIFQGLISSADHIYHLERKGPGRYVYQPPKPDESSPKPPAEEVSIEDDLMHPLVSGAEANRYQSPETTTYVLFPYEATKNDIALIPAAKMSASYPKAWAYLKRHEIALRARESGKFDSDSWYQFGRPQNLDKQAVRKLIVAQTVNRMSVCPDDKGAFYLNNVRVNGILPTADDQFWYLLGILNSRVSDWAFRRIAKPKEGGYFEANRQFIAPLPIPKAAKADADLVSVSAKRLTQLHTKQREDLLALQRRLETCDAEERPVEWLWPKLVQAPNVAVQAAPTDLAPAGAKRWAKALRLEQAAKAEAALQDSLPALAALEAHLVKGELQLSANGVTVLDSVFVDASEASQVLVNWQLAARAFSGLERIEAPELGKALRELRITSNKALAKQIDDIAGEVSATAASIEAEEKKLDALCYKLFNLSKDDIALVEAG